MKIALVAMNATGAARREPLGPGFDYKAFAARNRAIASLPSLALLTLAGMAGPRHVCHYYEWEDLRHTGLPQGYDLVCLSTYTAQVLSAYAVARRCREQGVPAVIGGVHVSVLPEEAAAHCDAVVVGEGESVWLRVLEDAEAGRLQPVYGDLHGGFDLRNAPMPAFELLDGARYSRIPVESSRGCPHRCEFCASSTLLSGQYKQKPAARVLAEIDRIKTLWPRPFIEFTDDNTFVNRAYWLDLFPELRKRSIRWFAEADIRLGQDEEFLRLMRESGCRQVLIGIESPSVADLDGVELKTNWKRRHAISPEKAVHTIQSAGIMVNGCFVLGLDSQGPEVFDAVYEFARQTDLFDVQITFLTPFPGTPLYTRLKREGRLLEETAWEKCTLFDIVFQPKRMEVEALASGFRDLAARLYNDAFTRQRRRNLRRRLRQSSRPAP